MPLLEIEDLDVHFSTRRGVVKAVEGVSFAIEAGEILGLIGESGSGKSVTALSIVRMLEPRAGRVARGRIQFDGQDILHKTSRQMRALRGREIAMILQDPLTSLNPVLTIGTQVGESVRRHRPQPRRAIRAEVIRSLQRVRIAAAEARLDQYPHQISGGMRQRVATAAALAGHPRLLIADEPTTALDVTVQAQILALLMQLQRELDLAILLITHDLGVVAAICHRVIVMYAGRIVESASAEMLFKQPRHPYTIGLLRSLSSSEGSAERFFAVSGQLPDPLARPIGCRFAPRCSEAMDVCRREEPPIVNVADGHRSACWLHAENPA